MSSGHTYNNGEFRHLANRTQLYGLLFKLRMYILKIQREFPTILNYNKVKIIVVLVV